LELLAMALEPLRRRRLLPPAAALAKRLALELLTMVSELTVCLVLRTPFSCHAFYNFKYLTSSQDGCCLLLAVSNFFLCASFAATVLIHHLRTLQSRFKPSTLWLYLNYVIHFALILALLLVNQASHKFSLSSRPSFPCFSFAAD
jgi:hypothetical protein